MDIHVQVPTGNPLPASWTSQVILQDHPTPTSTWNFLTSGKCTFLKLCYYWNKIHTEICDCVCGIWFKHTVVFLYFCVPRISLESTCPLVLTNNTYRCVCGFNKQLRYTTEMSIQLCNESGCLNLVTRFKPSMNSKYEPALLHIQNWCVWQIACVCSCVFMHVFDSYKRI